MVCAPSKSVSRKACALFLLWAATPMALPAQTLTTLLSFDSTDGDYPETPLVQGADGNFYGTTPFGGAHYYSGTIFKITPSGKLTTLHNFCSQSACTDGDAPYGSLVQAANGDFYGTTYFGGAGNVAPCDEDYTCGTVYKISPSGKLSSLYTFCQQLGCADGSNPNGGLVQASDGDLYGTTYYGGNSSCTLAMGCGTIFKMSPSGTLTTLYRFCAQAGCPDGYGPQTTLIQATDGNFYGTAQGGPNGAGTIFKVTPGGTLTTLYTFCSQPVNNKCMDGTGPGQSLVQATDGNFYGTTRGGGAYCDHGGCGTVFRISPSGTLTTLYSFCDHHGHQGCRDGRIPFAALIQTKTGDLYGSTSGGGANGDHGTIFKITLAGELTTIYGFCAQPACADGSFPAGLTQARNGDLYGTTSGGGATVDYCTQGCGTIFRLSPR